MNKYINYAEKESFMKYLYQHYMLDFCVFSFLSLCTAKLEYYFLFKQISLINSFYPIVRFFKD